jgi:Na+/proline symporter/signal transduction histidine kinase
MFEAYVILALALAYLSVLFMIAWIGDMWMRSWRSSQGRPLIYALSIAVYCTTWTFFGSVGRAAQSQGYDFLAVYAGPILMFIVGWPIIRRVVQLSKAQNITSVADFIAARYGKSPAVAAIVTLLAVFGTLPYVALQLKAVSISTETLLGGSPLLPFKLPLLGIPETAFLTAIFLAVFAILFGTRHIDATEHQDGLILAIATESIVKLAAFLTVGFFAVFVAFGDLTGFIDKFYNSADVKGFFDVSLSGSAWLTIGLLSFVCILLLPRQFHVTVVENHSENELRRARWLIPLYLVLINLFVVPIAATGLLQVPSILAEPDMYVLAIPMVKGANAVTAIAYIGGLSAGMAMVVVEMVALSIMVSNGVVVPFLLRQRALETNYVQNLSGLLINIRRAVIVVVMALCYLVYDTLGSVQGLAAIGLISFAAIAQLAPAFFGGLMWRRATTTGAIAGMIAGSAVWGYTLVLPWVVKAGWMSGSILADGPFGIAALRPQALLFIQFEPLTHGVFWSLFANVIAYVGFSLIRQPEPIERLQAHVFVQSDYLRPVQEPAVKFWRTSVTYGDLQATAARYLGRERAERAFAEYALGRGETIPPHSPSDVDTVRFTEHLLTSAIGAASARLVLSLLLRRGDVSSQSALKLLDDASEALQYNRDLLQSAIDQVLHGLSVFDNHNRLVCWNRQFSQLLDLPSHLRRVGAPLDQILRVCAERGDFGEGDTDALVADRLMRLSVDLETYQERFGRGEKIIEIRTARMPQGGFVATYLDITAQVAAADALASANQTLEQRVRERTAELLDLNTALAIAKSQADAASLDKTRFIAAASHDILQPLNAARLYASALADRELAPDDEKIASRIDASLGAVEEILKALVDISRMDSGRLEPEIDAVCLDDVLDRLRVEFEPIAKDKGLSLCVVSSTAWVRTDEKLLRRILQNLIGNAIKYTSRGRVLLGARRRQSRIELQVYDTGPGIPADKTEEIFKEFKRLDETAGSARGIGLGLSIVERIGRVLSHPITVRSELGRGACFTVSLPPAAARTDRPATEHLPHGGPLSDARILCIENEPVVLDGMMTLLRGWNCQVTGVSSQREALAVLAVTDRSPDVILADYHLDEGTGENAVLAIRRELGSDTPGVIITADHTPEIQRRLKQNGFQVLRKPVKAAALRALITQYARRKVAAE